MVMGLTWFDEMVTGIDNRMNRAEKYRDAVARLRRAIQSNPSSWKAYFQLGTIFQDNQANREAIACFKKVVSLNKEHFDPYFRLGLAYQDEGKGDSAIEAYQSALELKPLAFAAYVNLGSVFQMTGQLTKAINLYETALQLFPDNPVIYTNMGTVYATLKKNKKAIHCYEKAVALKPDYQKAVCYLYKQDQNNCNWRRFQAFGAQLDLLTSKSIEKGQCPEETPFLNISRSMDPAENYAVANAWSRSIESRQAPEVNSFLHKIPRSSKEVIKIGYFSNSFCDHPGGHLLHDIFSLHDRKQFMVYGYSVGPDDGSPYRNTIINGCDVFHNLQHAKSEAIAHQIKEDQIDILIDLMGYTTQSRMDVAALRPAPIQVRYLGMAGTTGARYFDYLIADSIVIPPGQAKFYSESLVYLPYSYQINSRRYIEEKNIELKDDIGLSSFEFVYCSFNTSYKIEPIIFRSWMRILKRVPESALWLLGGNKSTEDNLRHEAKKAGVAPHRIVFAKKIPKKDHLLRLQYADLILDTRIVNGAASTSDALWMGVPVLTLQGSHFASRMSSSLLCAMDLPELVTKNLDTYENQAVILATVEKKLHAIRLKIENKRLSSPLFNTSLSVRFLENAFIKMWHRYAKGDRPSQLRVKE